MTNNQLHGKKFEDFIKACGLFPGAADSSRSVTAGFDIEARFDRRRGLPTSIKTSGNDTIALSDARRFFSLNQDFRMIVGRYQQSGDQKIFSEIHEFILSRDALRRLRGTLDVATVTAFHEGLLLDKFPSGKHEDARAWASERKRRLADLDTAIILNPKIDSKTSADCNVRSV